MTNTTGPIRRALPQSAAASAGRRTPRDPGVCAAYLTARPRSIARFLLAAGGPARWT